MGVGRLRLMGYGQTFSCPKNCRGVSTSRPTHPCSHCKKINSAKSFLHFSHIQSGIYLVLVTSILCLKPLCYMDRTRELSRRCGLFGEPKGLLPPPSPSIIWVGSRPASLFLHLRFSMIIDNINKITTYYLASKLSNSRSLSSGIHTTETYYYLFCHAAEMCQPMHA